MSKLRKKIVVPISLTLTGCLVVAAFVLNDSLTKVDANVAFNGISDIVSSHGKDKTFNIVEVVPDKQSLHLLLPRKRITQSPFTMSRMRKAMSIRAMTGVSLPL